MLDPAKTVIEICGGFRAVAEATGRDETRVRRWAYPREKGGTGGLIPTDVQQVLMREAAVRGWPLRADHFFVGLGLPQVDDADLTPSPGAAA